MNIKNYTDIPFGTDSELMKEEISIPDGFEAVIEGNKIILKKVECDDERVKNRLIKLIKMSSEVGGFALHKWEADEMLTWLEKQGEQKPTLPKWKYKKDNTTLLKDSLVLNKCGHMAKLSSGAIVSDVWVLDYDELAKLPKEEVEKQGEQNPTDKVEPKFKVGDWIVNRLGNIWHIDSFDAKNYQVTNTKGEHNYFPINIQDRMHLWTIADAKEGDVVATEPIDAYPSPFVAIYKIRRPDYFNSYCLIRFDGKFYEADTGHSIENIYPATKEQRDLLFQKMKEAGYEWDAENLQLTKILHVKELSDGINIDKQKLVEWSEEDERNLNDAILFIETGTYSLDKDNLINWLKSLRPQNTWKPSEEQIEAVKRASNGSRAIASNDYLIMESLYNDLKKLKGE